MNTQARVVRDPRPARDVASSAPSAGLAFSLSACAAVLDESRPFSFDAPMTFSEIVAWHWDCEGGEL